jgi:replicative DNA helicase
MADLILRAEQGVLGAMLRNPNRPDIITDGLTADDFGHPQHAAVYEALLDPNVITTSNLDERITNLVAVADADLDPGWLRTLAETDVREELVREYARIVVQGAFERDIADFADPYEQAAALADDPETRDGLLQLAEVFDNQVTYFGEAAAIDPAADIVLTNSDLDVDLGNVLEPEDQVIADIVQHPEQAREVAAWLESDIFTTGRRRHTFEFAVSLAYDDDPFDSVTLAWNLNQAQNYDFHNDPGQTEPAQIDADYAYVTRLYAATIVAGTAVVVGRDLLSAHVQARHQISITASTQQIVQVEQPAPGPQPGMDPPLEHAPAADIRPIEL